MAGICQVFSHAAQEKCNVASNSMLLPCQTKFLACCIIEQSKLLPIFEVTELNLVFETTVIVWSCQSAR